MRLLSLTVLVLMALVPPAAAVAQESCSAAQGEAVRMEIERILEADNLDASRLSPREIADTIAGIARGGAPRDFWEAYQAHVGAWRRLADVVDRIVRQQGESTFIEGEEELIAAERAVETTFNEVERIARGYGARLPTPRGNIVPTI